MNDEAFDLVEPIIQAACPAWTCDHRYGVFELSVSDRKRLLRLLRDAEAESDISGVRNLYGRLADWIGDRCAANQPVSIFGY
jgi:hypothetical protein